MQQVSRIFNNMKNYLSSLNRLWQITSYLWLITIFNQSAHSITLRLQTSTINKFSLLSEEYILSVQEKISIQQKKTHNKPNIKNIKFTPNKNINEENKLSQVTSVVSSTNINTCQGKNKPDKPSVDLGAGVILLPQVEYADIFKGIYDYDKTSSCYRDNTNDINTPESEITFVQFTINVDFLDHINDQNNNQFLNNDHKDLENYGNLGIKEDFLKLFINNFDDFEINNGEGILSQEEKLEFIKSKYRYLNGYNFDFNSSEDVKIEFSETQKKLQERLQQQLEKQREKQEKIQERMQEKIERDIEKQKQKKARELEKKKKEERKKKEQIQKKYQ